MEKQFELLKATRNNIIQLLESSNREILFTIPKGHKNHIFWNIMHVLASQQLLIYGLSNKPFRIEKDIVLNYRSGTLPSPNPDIQLFDQTKSLLDASILSTIEDYQNGYFEDYKEVPTSYGLTLRNVEDAIYFNNLHEAMHYGQMKAMKQLLSH